MTDRAKILVASADEQTRGALTGVLQACRLEALHSSSISETRDILSREEVSVVFCGPSLKDGTCQELQKSLQAAPVPVVLASPGDPQTEFHHYLNSLRMRAFDFLCFPYERREVMRIMQQVLHRRGPRGKPAAFATT